MKAFSFACFCFLLLSAFVLTEADGTTTLCLMMIRLGVIIFLVMTLRRCCRRPVCLVMRIQDTLWKTKYWLMKNLQG